MQQIRFKVLMLVLALSLLMPASSVAQRDTRTGEANFDKVGYVQCRSSAVCVFRIQCRHKSGGHRITVHIRGVRFLEPSPDCPTNAHQGREVAETLHRLLRSVIHHTKRIALRGVLRLADGTFLADVMVDGQNLAALLREQGWSTVDTDAFEPADGCGG